MSTSPLYDFLPYAASASAPVTVARQHIDETIDLYQTTITGTARTDQRRVFAEAEGVWWIRGHHDATSEEGKALIAAASLYWSL